MFIQTEPLPDPDTMRFLPGRRVAAREPVSFADATAAAGAPLARRLFAVDGVIGIALEPEAIVVRKRGDVAWSVLKPPIFGAIMDHFADEAETAAADGAEDGRLAHALEALLGARVRPALAGDGGDIVLRGVAAGIAWLELRGAAFEMPLFAVRLRIENTIRHDLPGIRGVRFVPESRPRGAPRTDAGAGLDSPEGQALNKLLEESINPAVAAHGGHIALVDVRDGAAYIRLEGGCQGCGMSDITLRHGVETAIRASVPGITEVFDVTDHDAGETPYFPSDGH